MNNSGLNLHIIEQHSNWSTQRHVVHNLFGANVLIVLILHKDGQEEVSAPRHLLNLRGQHADALAVLPEAELFVSGKNRQALPVLIIPLSLRGDEGVDLQRLFSGEHTDVPLAVVAHLACSVAVSHVVLPGLA